MPQRSPEDGVIDWGGDAEFIDRFIRAQTRPYPGAFTTLHGRRLTIWQAHKGKGVDTRNPGEVVKPVQGWCRVACGQGEIALLEVEYEGEVFTGWRIGQLFQGGEILGAKNHCTKA